MNLDLLTVVRTARSIHRDAPGLTTNGGLVRVCPEFRMIAERKAAVTLGASVNAPDGRYPIQIVRVHRFFGNLHSQVWFRREHGIVELSGTLNKCWTRFCTAKELLHAFTGCTDGLTSAEVQVKLARDSRFILPDKQLTGVIDDETFCLYLAIEILLPWSHRGELSDMKHQGESTQTMAKRFMVPQVIIQHYFDCGYAAISWDVNRQISE